MSDTESQVDEGVEVDDDLEELDAESGMSPEELKAEVARLRKENASRRVKSRSQRETDSMKLKEYEDWKKSQLSETDRVKAEKEEIEKELRELRQEKWRSSAAKKAKLDPDLAERIHGETEEEMLEDAKRLAKKYPDKGASEAATASDNTPTAGGLFAGTRGRPVGANSGKSATEQFRDLFHS